MACDNPHCPWVGGGDGSQQHAASGPVESYAAPCRTPHVASELVVSRAPRCAMEDDSAALREDGHAARAALGRLRAAPRLAGRRTPCLDGLAAPPQAATELIPRSGPVLNC